MPTRPVPITDTMRWLSESMPKHLFKQARKTSPTDLLEIDVTALGNAAYGERTVARNGHRARDLESRVGTIPLAVPWVHQWTDVPRLLGPRRRWEQAFVQVVAEAYVMGVSTRKVGVLGVASGAKGKK
jgi:putative transposase